DTGLSGELLEDVDMYIGQVGQLLKVYGRLARSAGEEDQYFQDIQGLLTRMSNLKSIEESTFFGTYRIVMQDFLFEVADEISFSSAPFHLGKREPEVVLRDAILRLQK